MDFTKSLNNGESNTYHEANPTTSGNNNFSDLFKAFKEDDKKTFCRAETPVGLPVPLETLINWGNDMSLHGRLMGG